jgi:hypothetical protein
MANFLQISEQALDTDWQGVNYGTADIAAYSVVIIDGSTSTRQISPANVIDGVAVGLTGSTGALVVGVAMETIRGTTFTGGGTSGGPPGVGRIRSIGIAPVTASAALAPGVRLMLDGTGTGSVIQGTTASAQCVIGTALTGATSASDTVAVLLGICNFA